MNEVTLWLTRPPVRVPIPPAPIVRAESHGEVTSTETLDFQTLKPMPDGLFCERIFGPVSTGMCACGGYSGELFAGQVCPQCGVQVASSEARAQRKGHIELAVPVCHPEYARAAAQPLARWCGLEQETLEGLLYYTHLLVLGRDPEAARQRRTEVLEALRGVPAADVPPPAVVHETLERIETLAAGDVLTAEEAGPFRAIRKALAGPLPGAFEQMLDLRVGAEAVRTLLERAGRPDRGSAVLECLPVIPPGARQVRRLDERRLAIHEVNDLYRRVINRNRRLRLLTDIDAPDAILDREKRRLQEAVDALIDNAHAPEPVLNSRGVPMKCLADLTAPR